MARLRFPGFPPALKPVYTDDNLMIRIIYATKEDPATELQDACPQVTLMYGVVERYFLALVKTIEKSARNELLKFLKLEYRDVGDACLTSGQDNTTYTGFLLPEGQSSYPQGYKIVSFYADPERLIEKCYVLRRDGWRGDLHLYQRILAPEKVRKMRTYLSHEKRVYVNNIIATLPSSTQINDAAVLGRNIPEADLGRAKPVSIQIPAEYDSICIVDGQHRVFCYHEGTDKAEDVIRHLRKRQTLLVTGIVYPESVPEDGRRQFEARLFLEINNNQTRVKSALTQEIALLLNPYSPISLAKRVVKELAKRGPYKGLLQTGFFDSPYKIKTTSIVSYGLRPLVKLDGRDSLYSVWNRKAMIHDGRGEISHAEAERYVAFCVEKINDFMLAAKLAHAEAWNLGPSAKSRSPLMKPTVINGLIVCLRRIIAAGLPLDSDFHKGKLIGLSTFGFDGYKSSQWQRLGSELFRTYYGGGGGSFDGSQEDDSAAAEKLMAGVRASAR